MLAVWSFFYRGKEYCVLCVKKGRWPLMVFNAATGASVTDKATLAIAFSDKAHS
jgi:hypothetical protein